jgi:hypothetical protein
VIVGLVATPFGSLFLGRFGVDNLRPLTAIPLSARLTYPQSTSGVPLGVDHEVSLHRDCSALVFVDFDGSLWRPNGPGVEVPLGESSGNIRRTEGNRAALTVAGVGDVEMHRIAGPIAPSGDCLGGLF